MLCFSKVEVAIFLIHSISILPLTGVCSLGCILIIICQRRHTFWLLYVLVFTGYDYFFAVVSSQMSQVSLHIVLTFMHNILFSCR